MRSEPWIVVYGATSRIAQAAAVRFASKGYGLVLIGRNQRELVRIGSDLEARYEARHRVVVLDILDKAARRRCTESLIAENCVVGVVWAVGSTPDAQPADLEPDRLVEIGDVNFVASMDVLAAWARYLERVGAGFIVAIGSVAGQFGRCANYPYGAAKAGLHVYMEGLRCRLASKGVRVVTIKPGIVDTRVSYTRRRAPFVVSPSVVGKRVADVALSGPAVVYVPRIWRLVMPILALLPTRVGRWLERE